jgi:hypothetical protein
MLDAAFRIVTLLSSVLCIISFTTSAALGAHEDAAPAIDLTHASVVSTNGAASCLVNSNYDKVELEASGAVDKDCDGDKDGMIDLDATRWTATAGVLDSSTGKTNKWKATTVDSSVGGTKVRAYFNDKDEGNLHDDEAGPKELAVTGFKVGCNLNTSKGGDYTKYHDNSTEGSAAENMSGEIGWRSKSAVAEQQDAAIATWKIVVSPANTTIKGTVTIKGQASSNQGSAAVAGKDGDIDDSGSASANVPSTVGNITFNHNFGGDDTVGTFSAVAAFQSDDGWMATKIVKHSMVTTTNPQSDSTAFSHTGNGTLTGKPGASKKGAFRAGYKIAIKETTPFAVSGVSVTGYTKWDFDISLTPTYNHAN